MKNFLVAKGIERWRLSSFGFGELNLVNKCDDNTECPEEMHQQNRRAEFRFTEGR